MVLYDSSKTIGKYLVYFEISKHMNYVISLYIKL